ncbi:MAG: hypothetical protein R2731_00535 [Nocardioides sp.]
MGIDWEGGCVHCRTCDGFPCRVGAKSDAETFAVDPAVATDHVTLLTRTTARRLVTRNGRVTAVEADGPDGPLTCARTGSCWRRAPCCPRPSCSATGARSTPTGWPTPPGWSGGTS